MSHAPGVDSFQPGGENRRLFADRTPMFSLGAWMRRRRARRLPLSEPEFLATAARLPGMAQLPAARLAQWQQLTREFLSDKHIHGAGGLEPDAAMRQCIAQLATWPILDLGYAALDGWHDVIVYPGAFRARRERHDEDIEHLVHEYEEELAGESMDHGPLVLSWDDILTDLEHPEEMQSLVVHEIAHKLDGLSGAVNGAPPMRKSMSQQAWTEAFSAAFEAMNQQLDAEQETVLDPYAASAPEEFFAVMSEYHFIAPDLLAEVYPQVAAQLRQFYGPSP